LSVGDRRAKRESIAVGESGEKNRTEVVTVLSASVLILKIDVLHLNKDSNLESMHNGLSSKMI
jgi:hypothetical protein